MKSNWFHKLWRQQREEELDAEIRNHLDDAVRERITRGESPDEARANALREFGNESLVNEVTRAVSKNARWRLRAVRARMGAA
ncbi:MAG TPA: permease prefix domain 1-containing protein, partial [Blastocatellia bacterium]